MCHTSDFESRVAPRQTDEVAPWEKPATGELQSLPYFYQPHHALGLRPPLLIEGEKALGSSLQ